MVSHNPSHKHEKAHDVVSKAARIGAVIGGTLGAIAGFAIDIDQILASGAKSPEGLLGVPPLMVFVGLMLGYALGASVGVGIQTLAGCCGCAIDSIKQQHDQAMA